MRVVDDGCVLSAGLATICRMTRGVRVAAAGMLMLTLVACSKGEARGKKPLPPLSSTPSAAITSPTSPSTSPRSTSPRAAVESFVREYFAEVDKAVATGNTARLLVLTDPRCECRETVGFVDRSYRSGSVRDLTTTVDRVEFQLLERDEAKVIVRMRASAYDILDETGRVKKRVRPVSRGVVAQTLAKRGMSWVITAQSVLVWER